MLDKDGIVGVEASVLLDSVIDVSGVFFSCAFTIGAK
jgi:hypothetical protein